MIEFVLIITLCSDASPACRVIERGAYVHEQDCVRAARAYLAANNWRCIVRVQGDGAPPSRR
jgi:hypothetical protein